jgi:transposase
VQTVCRDRAGAYAEAVRVGAPDAEQVADRWHLWHNLVEAVEKVVRQQHADLREPPVPPAAALSEHRDPITESAATETAATESAATGTDDPTADTTEDGPACLPRPTRLAARTRDRYAAIHALLAAGRSVSAISQTLGLDRKTVRRFARAGSVAELLTTHPSRGSVLDDYAEHLDQRWAAGVTNAAVLTAEITALGYRGSIKTVRRYLQPLRSEQAPTPRPPAPPTVRDVTGWLTRHPDSLTDDERHARDALLQRSPVLHTTYQRVSEFAEILTQRHGHELPSWMQQIASDGAPALRSFAAGLDRDLDAVTAGLTLPYSSGPVEGTINRIKMIKRQMFGRANLDLLRKRVLLGT